jgi:hypothetical protein
MTTNYTYEWQWRPNNQSDEWEPFATGTCTTADIDEYLPAIVWEVLDGDHKSTWQIVQWKAHDGDWVQIKRRRSDLTLSSVSLVVGNNTFKYYPYLEQTDDEELPEDWTWRVRLRA